MIEGLTKKLEYINRDGQPVSINTELQNPKEARLRKDFKDKTSSSVTPFESMLLFIYILFIAFVARVGYSQVIEYECFVCPYSLHYDELYTISTA